MLEIYLHLKYPIYVTKNCSYFIVKVLWIVILTSGVIIVIVICGALRDLVPFLQFKKREKHP